jgi:hypothetical protein
VGGQSTGPLASTQTYTLACTGPGGTVSDSVTINVTPNTPPLAPTISGVSTGFVTVSYPFTFTATDPDNDTIHYEIDWDNNTTVDQTLPAGFILSGSARIQPNDWTAAQIATFRARTVDSRGGVSGWTTKIVDITLPPVLTVSLLGDYGTVALNDTKNKTITITNTGGGTLNVTGITASAHFTCTLGCSGLLAAGMSQPATIRLTAPGTVPLPTPPGTLPTETITVRSTNASNGDQPVTAWATIVPAISINPGPLDFGDVIIRKFKDLPLTIKNNSSVPVLAGSFTVAAPFSCVPSGTSCLYGQINPGSSVQVMIRFSPTVVSNGQTVTGNMPLGTPLNNTGILVGNGVPLSFKVIER